MNDDRDLGGGEAMLLSIGQAGGRDLLTEAVDLGLDGALDPGLLRDLPVIGWFVKGADVAAAIRDRLFAKKLLGFVAGTNSASAGATKKFVDDLSEPKERRRAGEMLLGLIERHERVEKSFVLGRLLASRINGLVDGARFMELASALDRATIEELRRLKRLHYEERVDDVDAIWNLAHTGLVTVGFNDLAGFVAMGHHVNPLGEDMVRLGLADLDVGPDATKDFP